MYRMRESWTDERFDDFAKHIDQRFDGIDRRFDEVSHRFDRVEAGLRDLGTRFDGLQRTLLMSSFAVVAALIGVIATQL